MKKINYITKVLTVFIFLFFSACTGEETYFEYYEDGSVKTKASMKDGKPDGVVHFYAPDGSLYAKAMKKDGFSHGRTYYYHPNGAVKSLLRFKNDKQDGLEEKFDENGVLLQTVEWKDGVIDGWIRAFYSNGQLREEIKKKNGQFEGEYLKYSPEGRLIQKEIISPEGKTIYLWYLIDAEKNIAVSGPSSIIANERDTVSLGDTFKTTVSYGYKLNGEVKMFVVSSINPQGMVGDTLAVVKPSSDGKFSYSFNANKVGKNYICLVFSHKNIQGDTLLVDGEKLRVPYFVKE